MTLIRQGAAIDPDAPALSFFMSADKLAEAEVWTYTRPLAQGHANGQRLSRDWGCARTTSSPSSCPTFLKRISRSGAAKRPAIVAAFNPLLEASDARRAFRRGRGQGAGDARAVSRTSIFGRVSSPNCAGVESLQHVVLVNLADRVPGPGKELARQAQQGEVAKLMWRRRRSGQASCACRRPRFLGRSSIASRAIAFARDRKISAERSFLLLLHRRNHWPAKNRHAAARKRGRQCLERGPRFSATALAREKRFFADLPLFHVNGVIVTGLVPFSKGAHVVLGTPQGYRGEGVVARFWEIVEHFKINFFSGVPTLYASSDADARRRA